MTPAAMTFERDILFPTVKHILVKWADKIYELSYLVTLTWGHWALCHCLLIMQILGISIQDLPMTTKS